VGQKGTIEDFPVSAFVKMGGGAAKRAGPKIALARFTGGKSVVLTKL
jgi:hypothetical protein